MLANFLPQGLKCNPYRANEKLHWGGAYKGLKEIAWWASSVWLQARIKADWQWGTKSPQAVPHQSTGVLSACTTLNPLMECRQMGYLGIQEPFHSRDLQHCSIGTTPSMGYPHLSIPNHTEINPRVKSKSGPVCIHHLNGAFECNWTPIYLKGTRVVVHKNPSNQGKWAPHGVNGWYIGSVPDHYCCVTTWIWDTEDERIGETKKHFPCHVPMLYTSSANIARNTEADLTDAPRNPEPVSPFAPIGDKETSDLNKIDDVLQQSPHRFAA